MIKAPAGVRSVCTFLNGLELIAITAYLPKLYLYISIFLTQLEKPKYVRELKLFSSEATRCYTKCPFVRPSVRNGI